jgi:hypothetical protein
MIELIDSFKIIAYVFSLFNYYYKGKLKNIKINYIINQKEDQIRSIQGI